MSESVPSRTAVYGPVRTVVWQGSVGDRRPYADLVCKGRSTLGRYSSDTFQSSIDDRMRRAVDRLDVYDVARLAGFPKCIGDALQ
jgi:hypothetical protein